MASSALGVMTEGSSDAFRAGASIFLGGATAELTGGDFWEGATMSAIQVFANHLAHKISGDGKKYATSPVKDNFGKQNGECALRCLEEIARSYGDAEHDYDFWLAKNGGLSVEPRGLPPLLKDTPYYLGEIDKDPAEIYKAMNNNERLMLGVETETGGHAVMINKVIINNNGYKVYTAETSPVRQVPIVIRNFLMETSSPRIFIIGQRPSMPRKGVKYF